MEEEERDLISQYHLGVVAGSRTLMAVVPVELPSGEHRLVFHASPSPSQQHSEPLPQSSSTRSRLNRKAYTS
jgi:hypothetical protein